MHILRYLKCGTFRRLRKRFEARSLHLISEVIKEGLDSTVFIPIFKGEVAGKNFSISLADSVQIDFGDESDFGRNFGILWSTYDFKFIESAVIQNDAAIPVGEGIVIS